MSKIKTIPGRKYNPGNKSWDLPLQAIHKLKELFQDDYFEKIASRMNGDLPNVGKGDDLLNR